MIGGRPEGHRKGAIMIIQKASVPAGLTVEFSASPADAQKVLARLERARRNSRWLQAHWADRLPRAAGR